MTKALSLLALCSIMLPSSVLAQTEPTWAQREMERMQAEQERFNAQVERDRAERERRAAREERRRAEAERELDRSQADRTYVVGQNASQSLNFSRVSAVFEVATKVCPVSIGPIPPDPDAFGNALEGMSNDEGGLLSYFCTLYTLGHTDGEKLQSNRQAR